MIIMVVESILVGIFLVILLIVGLIILFKAAGIIIKILLHMALGFVLLFIVDLIPIINVPINIITVLVAGFGGVFGVVLLIILSVLGISWL
ncbi:sigmaK-factor processing regulatory BofA [Methanobacterium paludis]|uniref:SigmaK-factor processing regulatory BofA n=2 Tax=Methanobacterium paludis (strain DSM 25820 / JCM 18151 / SWAN1) TaxID=868131 RepID=F6D423_METPW|nr:sigmaK-factor processing regulatory BofA [Methanobacterium paludis]